MVLGDRNSGKCWRATSATDRYGTEASVGVGRHRDGLYQPWRNVRRYLVTFDVTAELFESPRGRRASGAIGAFLSKPNGCLEVFEQLRHLLAADLSVRACDGLRDRDPRTIHRVAP